MALLREIPLERMQNEKHAMKNAKRLRLVLHFSLHVLHFAFPARRRLDK
jgi:hypothetical protein